MVRSTVLLIILAGLAWWLHGEQSQGRFRQVDETFLDFLLSNTRSELKPDPAKLNRVVFASIRESDKAEYEAWPPAPIDYQMIIKGIIPHRPEVLVITEPLAWKEPKPEMIPQLAETLLPLPRVAIAAGARSGDAPGKDLPFAKDRLPQLGTLRGQTTFLPALTGIDRPPEDALARQSDVGVVVPGKQSIALRYAGGAVPSVELQTLAHATHVPFANQSLMVGPGAGAHLGDEVYIPLEVNGSFPQSTVTVEEVNALDLMTAAITNDDPALDKALGTGKIILLGMGDEITRQRAQSIATALAMPLVSVLPWLGQIIASVVAALLALWLVWIPKTKALTRAVILLFLALTASYLAFQSTKVWCPPAIPAALIAAGGVFARLFGKKVPA